MANKTKAYCDNCKQFYEGVNTSFPGGFPEVKCPQCGKRNKAPLTSGGRIARALGVVYILFAIGLSIKDGSFRLSLDVLVGLLILGLLIAEMLKDLKIRKQYKNF